MSEPMAEALARQKQITQHAGDCTIYSARHNGRPYDGICTCGYGWEYLRQHSGDDSQMLSNEFAQEGKHDA